MYCKDIVRLYVTRNLQQTMQSLFKKMSMAEDTTTDHTLYEVYQQPIALDRFSMHDIGSTEAAGKASLF